MEPNQSDGRVPDVDFAIDASSDTRPAPAESSARAEVHAVFASFDDFYASNRASVGRALAITLRDQDLARDAVDEAMARAYQRWSHVSQLENPGGWVYRVGLNWSRSMIRRWNRPTPIWLTQPNETPPRAMVDPTVDRALDTLSVDQRAVVVCRLLLGLSELQTADALRIRSGTVKSRLSRALDRLHPLLAPLEEN